MSQNIIKNRTNTKQKLVNWFVFFLAFPAINILGNSITFYILLALLFKVGFFWRRNFYGKYLLFSFLFLVILSSFSAPYNMMPRHPGISHTFKMVIQYAYWITAASFFGYYNKSINRILLGQYAFYGLIFATVSFYILPLKFNVLFLEISTAASRNSFVFTLLSCVPICFYYLYYRFGNRKITYFFLLFFFIVLFTNGRSGAIIIILELLFIAAVLNPYWLKILKFSIVPLFLLMIFAESTILQSIMNNAANSVESINPRFATLLRGENEGDLTFDKSWLIRKLMIDKSKEIIPQYPFLGIGANNFIYFDAKLNDIFKYDRLTGETMDFWNSRSAHNSYIQIVTEFGVPAFIIFLLLLSVPIFKKTLLFFQKGSNINYLPIISLIGISLHFYAISSITGAIAWCIIGMAWGTLKKQ